MTAGVDAEFIDADSPAEVLEAVMEVLPPCAGG
jgi:hypothetical protein